MQHKSRHWEVSGDFVSQYWLHFASLLLFPLNQWVLYVGGGGRYKFVSVCTDWGGGCSQLTGLSGPKVFVVLYHVLNDEVTVELVSIGVLVATTTVLIGPLDCELGLSLRATLEVFLWSRWKLIN